MLRLSILMLLAIIVSGCEIFPQAAKMEAATFESTPEADYFNIEPALIDRSGSVTLTWEAHGVERVAIEQYYGFKTAYDVRYDDLPPAGTLTVDLTSSQATDFSESQPYIYGATFYLMPNDKTGFYDGGQILAYNEVKIRCSYDGFFFGVDDDYADLCPLEPAHETPMDYQSFENGFMLRREDTGVIYVFYVNPGGESGPAVLFTPEQYAQFENLPPSTPEISAGGYTADENFARVIASNHALVNGLGEAASPVSRYDATVQDTYGYAFFHPVAYMTLPDGLVIQYFTGTYTNTWHYIDRTEE